MKPNKQKEHADDLRPEYDFDFSKPERRRLKTEDSNLVLVESRFTKSFPDSASVKAVLRSVVEFAKLPAGLTRHSSSCPAKRRTA